jgi:hypothetical protein
MKFNPKGLIVTATGILILWTALAMNAAEVVDNLFTIGLESAFRFGVVRADPFVVLGIWSFVPGPSRVPRSLMRPHIARLDF